jgi:hypothetical protein
VHINAGELEHRHVPQRTLALLILPVHVCGHAYTMCYNFPQEGFPKGVLRSISF